MNLADTPADAQARIRKILQLPPLSPIAQQLLGEVGREDVQISRLATTIEHDPALTARIIGLANSAYFGALEPIVTVADAIIKVLGLKLVKSIALGIAMSTPFDTSGCPDFRLDRYWYRAMQGAALTSRLGADVVAAAERDGLFLSGLLHNFGQLVLGHAFPDGMCAALHAWRENPDADLLDLERRYAGIDEQDAAVNLAHRWHLPPAIIAALAHQRDPAYRGEYWKAAHLVGYCGWLAERAWYDMDGTLAEPAPERAAPLHLREDGLQDALHTLAAQDDDVRALAQALAG